jgi:hypothetical protein
MTEDQADRIIELLETLIRITSIAHGVDTQPRVL